MSIQHCKVFFKTNNLNKIKENRRKRKKRAGSSKPAIYRERNFRVNKTKQNRLINITKRNVKVNITWWWCSKIGYTLKRF